MKRRLFERSNFGNAGAIGGQLVLNANDYDFELVFSKLSVDQAGKKSFVEPLEVPLQKQELYELTKGLFEPFVSAYNRVKFKVKELPDQHTFSDIKFVTRGLHGIRMIGDYVTVNGMKNRRSILAIYKFNSWDEVKQFNKDVSAFEGTEVAKFQFDQFSVSRGSFVYRDIVAIDELQEVISDAYFKRSSSYVAFLEDVMKQNGEGGAKPSATPTLGGPVNTNFKPIGIPNSDAPEFPF